MPPLLLPQYPQLRQHHQPQPLHPWPRRRQQRQPQYPPLRQHERPRPGAHKPPLSARYLQGKLPALRLPLQLVPDQTETPTPTVEAMMEPVSPRLVVSIPSPGHQVTMYHKTFFSSGGVLRPMYDFLIWNDLKTDEEKPMLASDWSISSDAMIWTFALREDVTFHDGTEFTSEDVRRSWEIITSESSIATGASDFRNLVGQAEKIDVSDPYRVVFNLTQPWVEFGFNVSEAYTLAVYSAGHWDRVGEDGYLNNPIGTGPFQVCGTQSKRISSLREVQRQRRGPLVEDSRIRRAPVFDRARGCLTIGDTTGRGIPHSRRP